MANKEQLKNLLQGTKIWNDWRNFSKCCILLVQGIDQDGSIKYRTSESFGLAGKFCIITSEKL
jgi:hypothetical protein